MMRVIETVRFGTVRFAENEVIAFPAGLPGFEDERQFLLIESAESLPLRFLQSVATPALCFVCAPVELVQPNYEGWLSPTDRDLLALEADAQEGDLEWLAILCFAKPDEPTANLLGPLVIHRAAGRGIQAVREDTLYSARQPLFAPTGGTEASPCS
jgi:flagellar assembly factor FliW